MRLITVLLLLGATCRPERLNAQQQLRVLDAHGVPVAAARVELWTPNALVSAHTTNDAGLVRLQASDLALASALVVRRIGFLPARELVIRELDSLVVHLEAIPGALPTVTVEASRRSCPQLDNALARHTWEVTAARYLSPSLEGRRATTLSRRTEVSVDAVGMPDDSAPAAGWRYYTRGGMLGARNTIATRGFVTPLSGTHAYDDFGIWRYPPLHAELAGQFADTLFGLRHSFTVSTLSTRATVLRFCAKNRRESGVEGTIRIDAAGAFLDARWTFWNPARDAESAGGEVIFAPPAEIIKEPLFSASGLFWRRLPSGRYLQSWQRYSAWRLLADSVGTNRAIPPGAP